MGRLSVIEITIQEKRENDYVTWGLTAKEVITNSQMHSGF
jgi:hypothetical protein